MAGHTPTPWCVLSEDIWSGDQDCYGVPLYRLDRGHDRRWGRTLTDEEHDANAALIVEAVNSHAVLAMKATVLEAEMWELLHSATSHLHTVGQTGQQIDDTPWIKRARAALAGSAP